MQNLIIQDRYYRMDWMTYGNQQRREGGVDMLVKQIKKKMTCNSFDQIVDECESTPEIIRLLYEQILAEKEMKTE